MTVAKVLKPEPLTRHAFLPFGQVLETDGNRSESINFGNTQKFGDLAEITLADAGRGQISIYRSSVIDLPFKIRLMERHPLGSQAFYPLHDRPFLVVVAAADTTPGFADIRVFLTNGRQGVNIPPGIWHHYQLTLGQESEYVVFDRLGGDENYQEHWFDEEILLEL